MPGLKGRFSTVVKSKISKQVDRAENPSETLDYAYERQLENLQNVKKGIADIATAKKRLALQRQQLSEQGAKLDAQAREAMSAGREDLARAALERKQLAVQEAGSLEQQLAELESEQGKLIESEQRLRARIEQLRSKKALIDLQHFEELTAKISDVGEVDPHLDQLGAKSVVDDEFARLKAEVHSGSLPRAPSRRRRHG